MTPPNLPLALTVGEPAGIGPDIALAAWMALRGGDRPFFLIGDPETLADRARNLGLAAPIREINDPGAAAPAFAEALPVIAERLAAPAVPGTLDGRNAHAVLRSIDRAAELALAGRAGGIVTGPIHKQALYHAGFDHQGHTDYLAHIARRCGREATPVMMLTARELRAIPVTVHIPLAEVAASLTRETIVEQGRVVARGLLHHFDIARPRLAVCGLNPHAGEGGTMGREEIDIIEPAVADLVREGVAVSGPHSADTMFHPQARAGYDAVLCMYHDQALIPVKTLAFHEAVNVTLGLPFVRTSPDHGTALPLAGTGRANPSSLIEAIRLAGRMAGS